MDLALPLFGHEFHLRSPCPRAELWLSRNFSLLLRAPQRRPFRRYDITPDGAGWRVRSDAGELRFGAAELIYTVEHLLVLDLQAARPDLLFVHAAVLDTGRGAVLLVAPSGTGKSTLTLALVEQGLGYLSDELAPLDVARGLVHPYPHALCLKSGLPEPYRTTGIDTGATAHIPAEHLHAVTGPLPLRALVFLRRGAQPQARISGLSRAATVAHLFPEILNGLAHPAYGIDAALHAADSIPGLLLDLGTPAESARLLLSALAELERGAAA